MFLKIHNWCKCLDCKIIREQRDAEAVKNLLK